MKNAALLRLALPTGFSILLAAGESFAVGADIGAAAAPASAAPLSAAAASTPPVMHSQYEYDGEKGVLVLHGDAARNLIRAVFGLRPWGSYETDQLRGDSAVGTEGLACLGAPDFKAEVSCNWHQTGVTDDLGNFGDEQKHLASRRVARVLNNLLAKVPDGPGGGTLKQSTVIDAPGSSRFFIESIDCNQNRNTTDTVCTIESRSFRK